MLACVCQPSDPNIFRKATIISNEKPLKITNRENQPKPGRTVRLKTEVHEIGHCAVTNPSYAEWPVQTAGTVDKTVLTCFSSNSKSSAIGKSPSHTCPRISSSPSDVTSNEYDKKKNDSSTSSDSCRSSPIRIYNPLRKSSGQTNSFHFKDSLIKSGGDLTNENTKLEVLKVADSTLFDEIGIPIIDISNTKERRSRDQNKSRKDSLEKLPDGVQLTLSELREMACRQQSQIDSQHQLLAAKEQRLRYLKEQEARQQRVQAESERLRRLRDRVDAQELKLRKLRALRGQVDHQKQNNLSLTSDLDSIRALFNEKEKELSLAVAKVEELTRQLEELKRGRSSRDQPPASALELDKLRRELMYRNKLNEQQNLRLNQQREALTARQEEMSAIDKRISELQERLHRKRLLNQQLANQISAASHKAAYHQLVRLTGNGDQNNQAFSRKQQQNLQQPSNGLSRGNIAAVEPYNHVPLQTGQPLRENNMQENMSYNPGYHPQSLKKDNDLIHSAYENQDMAGKTGNNMIPNRPDDIENLKEFTVSKSDPKYQTLPYNTKFTVNLLSGRSANTNVNNNNNKLDINEIKHIEKESEPSTISPNVGIHNGNVNYNQPSGTTHMTVHSAPLNILNKNIATPLNHNDLVLSRRNSSEQGSGKEQVVHGHQKIPDQTLYNNMVSPPPNITYQKPISSVAPTSIHHSGILSNVYQTSSIKVQPVEPQTTLSSNKQVPSPLNGRSSNNTSGVSLVLSPPQSSSTPYNNTPEVSIEKIPKPALPPKPAIKPPPRQTQHISQLIEENNAQPPPIPSSDPPEDKKPSPVPQRTVLPPPVQPPRTGLCGKEVTIEKLPICSTASITNQSYHQSSSEMIIKAKPLTIKKQPFTEQPKLRNVGGYKPNGSVPRRIEIPSGFQYQMTEKPLDSPSSTDSKEKDNTEKDEVDRAVATDENFESKSLGKDEKPIDGVIRRCKKGNLKQSGKQNLSRRVSFDPLALLLDASLEGELELVKKTATQVANPSAANDEGITALHNAICAGHLEIVKFLVEFGCDVNAQDSDGWTPLHCGASCNNVAMVKFLVEHGACIFATTLSDHETAAEKCEEDEEGFDGCSEYLYSVQEKLGILSNGAVYAVFDYTAQQPDELSFKSGQQLTVLRKGDENEREWWWCRLGDKEGYVPRNLLGLYPRVVRSED